MDIYIFLTNKTFKNTCVPLCLPQKVELHSKSSLSFLSIYEDILKQYRSLSYSWSCSIPHVSYSTPFRGVAHNPAGHSSSSGCSTTDSAWSSWLFVGLSFSLSLMFLKLHNTFVHRWVILLSYSVYQSRCAPVCVLTSHTLALQLERLKQRLVFGFHSFFPNGNLSEGADMSFGLRTSEICNWFIWNSWNSLKLEILQRIIAFLCTQCLSHTHTQKNPNPTKNTPLEFSNTVTISNPSEGSGKALYTNTKRTGLLKKGFVIASIKKLIYDTNT